MGNYPRVLVCPGATRFWEGGTVGQVFAAPVLFCLFYSQIFCNNLNYSFHTRPSQPHFTQNPRPKPAPIHPEASILALIDCCNMSSTIWIHSVVSFPLLLNQRKKMLNGIVQCKCMICSAVLANEMRLIDDAFCPA